MLSYRWRHVFQRPKLEAGKRQQANEGNYKGCRLRVMNYIWTVSVA